MNNPTPIRSPSARSFSAQFRLSTLLTPAADEVLCVLPVSQQVNSSRNNWAKLLEAG